jgi:hypothetical protein
MQLENGEVLTQEQSKALWDEVAAETKGAAEAAPINSVKSNPVKVEPAKEVVPVVDPFKASIAELEAKFEKRMRDISGHIGGLKDGQLKMQETLTAASKAAAQVSDAPTQAQMDAAAGNKQKWNTLETQYPEWTQAFEHRLSQVPQFDAAAIDKMVSDRIKGVSDTVKNDIINNTLEAVYPGWADEVKSETFDKWLQSQQGWKPEFSQQNNPELVKFIAENKSSPIAMFYSDKIGDAAKMLRLYETSRTAETAATTLQQQRQETLNSATGAPKRGIKTPAAKAIEDMNPRELWNHEAKIRDAKKNRGY